MTPARWRVALWMAIAAVVALTALRLSHFPLALIGGALALLGLILAALSVELMHDGLVQLFPVLGR